MNGVSRQLPASRDDGVTEYGLLDSEDQEVFDSPDGDPRKRGTVTAAVGLGVSGWNIRPTPPPADHPYAKDALVVAVPTTDLRIVGDIGSGLAHLYEEDRARRDAEDALRDFDPRRMRP